MTEALHSFSQDFREFIGNRLMSPERGEDYAEATQTYREVADRVDRAINHELFLEFESAVNSRQGEAEEYAYRRGFADVIRLMAEL